MTVSFVVSLLVQRSESLDRDRLAQAALYEIQLEGYRFLATYFEITDPPWAFDNFDFDRHFHEYEETGSGGPLFSVVCAIDYRLHGVAEVPYGVVWASSMERYTSQLEAIAILHQRVLSDSVMLALTRVVTHPWSEFVSLLAARVENRLRRGHAGVPPGQPDAGISCGPGEDGQHHLDLSREFSDLLLALEKSILEERSRIEARGIEVQNTFIHQKRPFWYDS